MLAKGARLLADLVAHDDWIPFAFTEPGNTSYRQYLLHCDSLERFSVVCFVWRPGQRTPIHNHTVWGLVGVLRGGEISQAFRWEGPQLVEAGPPKSLMPGTVEHLSPRLGDIHRVSNAYDDRVSISVHVYGANIGTVRRTVFSPKGDQSEFISGYANSLLPNIWKNGQ